LLDAGHLLTVLEENLGQREEADVDDPHVEAVGLGELGRGQLAEDGELDQ
jgi:hypothetical protein